MFNFRSRCSPRLALAIATTAALVTGTACARKSGCPINEPAAVKTDKEGNFKRAKGSSNLFPKDMRRRGRRG